jgi:hypothetical protein
MNWENGDVTNALRFGAVHRPAAPAAFPPNGVSLPDLTRQLSRELGHRNAGTLARELRRRIPAGSEEAALMAALEAVALTAVALQGGAWRWPGSPRGGRPRTAAAAEKDAKALGLHGQGMTYQQIADEMGMRSKGSAYLAVQRAIADLTSGRPAPSGEARPVRASGAASRTKARTQEDARAAALHQQGLSYARVAAEMGLGSTSAAYRAAQRGLAAQARHLPAVSDEIPAPGVPGGPAAA